MRTLLKSLLISHFLRPLVLTIVFSFSQFPKANAQGIPFLRNYTADDYHAHSRNFDIVTDDDGTVYVANFEGLLYYDNVEWRMIHTPGINRVTVVYCDANGTIWTGGYNYIGRIGRKDNGELYLQQVGKPGLFRGEVQEIWEKDGSLYFVVNNGFVYQVKGDEVTTKSKISDAPLNTGLDDVVQTEGLIEGKKFVVLEDITQTEPLENGMKVLVKRGHGLIFTDDTDKELFTIDETNGLCSDNVSWVAYNGHGLLWGATDNGIFSIAIPSVYSRFTPREGLMGEALSMLRWNGQMLIGTPSGVYRQQGMRFVPVQGISNGCWQLEAMGSDVLAATANGVYRMSPGGTITQLTSNSTTSLLVVGNTYFSGEMDGVYLNTIGSGRRQISDLEKATKIVRDNAGAIWIQNLYGEIWRRSVSDAEFHQVVVSNNKDEAGTIVDTGSEVIAVGAVDTSPFAYPQYSYTDAQKTLWLTDNKGKHLYAVSNGQRLTDYDQLLSLLSEEVTRAMFRDGQCLWLGGDGGVTIVDMAAVDPALQTKPRLLMRSITLGGDSILWGGYGEMPKQLPELASNENHLRFTYSVDYAPLLGTTLYRYRLNGNAWSPWADDHDAEFLNLHYGSYQLEVQALTATGQETDVTSIEFHINSPFYVRWYMLVFYVLLLAQAVYIVMRWRLHRLEKDKRRLESIVQERTAEVVRQKDEIEEKSKSLETALSELHDAQGELIRQEKMATVGKLTQGLIDRILNPLNYINNFSRLSEGLIKDVRENIEDDKDGMDAENYEDTMDALDMLTTNLQKVSEHGQHTTLTLKAMEEMLKDRSGGMSRMSLTAMLRLDEEMLLKYYANDIAQYSIQSHLDCPADTDIWINGNGDQLSKTVMSLLGNSVHAVVKKAQREQYQPEITIKAATDGHQATIVVRDNGIGIEEAIIDKIFDPFFTTKTTAEAAGVGLYLSHEIVQNHGGDITVASVKNEYSEFTITLPALTE